MLGPSHFCRSLQTWGFKCWVVRDLLGLRVWGLGPGIIGLGYFKGWLHVSWSGFSQAMQGPLLRRGDTGVFFAGSGGYRGKALNLECSTLNP